MRQEPSGLMARAVLSFCKGPAPCPSLPKVPCFPLCLHRQQVKREMQQFLSGWDYSLRIGKHRSQIHCNKHVECDAPVSGPAVPTPGPPATKEAANSGDASKTLVVMLFLNNTWGPKVCLQGGAVLKWAWDCNGCGNTLRLFLGMFGDSVGTAGHHSAGM